MTYHPVLRTRLILGFTESQKKFSFQEFYTSLFNGTDLTGWCFRAKTKKEDPKTGDILEKFDGKTASSDAHYSANDGVLTVTFPSEIDKLTGQLKELP